MHKYLEKNSGCPIIAINKTFNRELQETSRFRQLVFDLNPLKHPGEIQGFATELSGKLAHGLHEVGCDAVELLIQTAGVYDYGNFLDYCASRRTALLGLNVLGTAEVLHAVMALNNRRGLPNSKTLIHILVGAFQGLKVRANRSLYASTKAWGLDFCTSLAAGAEVAKCIYAAPVPIDTPMLHKNHWVNKAGGPENFFEAVLNRTRAEYDSIFRACDDSVLREVGRKGFESELESLGAALVRYREERIRAHDSDLGVITAAYCASVLLNIVERSNSESGVYLITDKPPTFAKFDQLNRYNMFLSVAKELRTGARS